KKENFWNRKFQKFAMNYYDDEKKQLSIVEELQDRHQQLVSQRFQFRPHPQSSVIVEEFKEEDEGENERMEEQLDEEKEENLFRGPEKIYERYTAENAEDWEIDPLDNDKDQLVLDSDQIGAEEEDLKEQLEQIPLPNRKYPRNVANEWEDEIPPARRRDVPYGPEGGPLWYYYWARRDRSWCFMSLSQLTHIYIYFDANNRKL